MSYVTFYGESAGGAKTLDQIIKASQSGSLPRGAQRALRSQILAAHAWPPPPQANIPQPKPGEVGNALKAMWATSGTRREPVFVITDDPKDPDPNSTTLSLFLLAKPYLTDPHEFMKRNAERPWGDLFVTLVKSLYPTLDNLGLNGVIQNLTRGYLPYFPLDWGTDSESVNIVPNFTTNRRAVGPWKVAVTASEPGLVGVAGRPELNDPRVMEAIRNTSIHIARKYCLTNGFYEGQMNRLAGCWHEARAYSGVSPFNRPDYSRVLKERFLTGTYGLVSEDSVLRLMMPTNVDEARFFKVSMESDAGIIWRRTDLDSTANKNTVVRANVMLSDLAIACRGIQRLYEAEPEAVEPLIDSLKHASIVELKPKFEIIEKEKMRTKVRNVMVFDSYLQLPLGIALSIMSDRIPKWLGAGDSPANRSLYGFVAFYGGLDRTIRKMTDDVRSTGRRFGTYFYSDNIYVYDAQTNEITSMDVTKMEATSTSEEARRAFSCMLATLGWNPTWRISRLLLFLFAEVSHYCPIITQDYLSVFPGLSSGSQGTFVVNHLRNVFYSDLVERYLNDTYPNGTDTGFKVDQVVAAPGLRFELKVTAVTGDPSQMKKLRAEEPVKYVSMANARPYPIDEFSDEVCPFDFLGFDGQYVIVDGEPVWVAVLSYERLYKAIMFRKRETETPETGNVELDGLLGNVINLTTMFTLYMTGGYGFRTTHTLILRIVAVLMAQINETINTAKAIALTTGESAETRIRNHVRREAAAYVSGNADDDAEPNPEAGYDADGAIVDGITHGCLMLLTTFTDAQGKPVLDWEALGLTHSQYSRASWDEYFTRDYAIRNFHTRDSIELRRKANLAKEEHRAAQDPAYREKREQRARERGLLAGKRDRDDVPTEQPPSFREPPRPYMLDQDEAFDLEGDTGSDNVPDAPVVAEQSTGQLRDYFMGGFGGIKKW